MRECSKNVIRVEEEAESRSAGIHHTSSRLNRLKKFFQIVSPTCLPTLLLHIPLLPRVSPACYTTLFLCPCLTSDKKSPTNIIYACYNISMANIRYRTVYWRLLCVQNVKILLIVWVAHAPACALFFSPSFPQPHYCSTLCYINSVVIHTYIPS